jgi:hypothetical protein
MTIVKQVEYQPWICGAVSKLCQNSDPGSPSAGENRNLTAIYGFSNPRGLNDALVKLHFAERLPHSSRFGSKLRGPRGPAAPLAGSQWGLMVEVLTAANHYHIRHGRSYIGCRRFRPHPRNRCCNMNCPAVCGIGNLGERTFLAF